MPDDTVFSALRTLVREAPVAVRVQGDCMAPWFAEGDRIVVSAGRLYWPGDVLVVRAPDGRLLAHRLLGYRPWDGGIALVTRGDACALHDFPVPLSAVLGRVDGARPSFARRMKAVLGFVGWLLRRRGSPG